MNMKKGFTLIELLIVVAIIAILAAIAVPNFLEAQTRSKVSRVKSDLRTIATGLHAYFADTNYFPPDFYFATVRSLNVLTTPVAYLSSMNIEDPFTEKEGGTIPNTPIYWQKGYQYMNFHRTGSSNPLVMNWIDNIGSQYAQLGGNGYVLISFGPDRKGNSAEWAYINYNYAHDLPATYSFLYDPTNGTISAGDITRFGGEVRMPAGF